MTSRKTGSKKASTRTKTKSSGTRKRRRAEAVAVMESSLGKRQKPTLGLETLEDAQQSLTEGSRRVLETILTDIFPEKDGEQESAVIAGIKGACQRAQMTKAGDEKDFWRHVGDAGFLKVVKETGAGLIGMHVLPLVATLLNIAIYDKKQWALDRCLQIAGLMPTKYDIYQLRWDMRHTEINAGGDVNLASRSDSELEGILEQIHDVTEEAEIINSA